MTTKRKNLNLYAKITKVDAEQRMVWGYASTEALDSQGEVIERGAIEKALDGYMEFANIREMHTASAVGVTKEAEMDEKGLFIGAHVVDDMAWKKVTSGVYKGFSIGGMAGKRKGNRIKEIELYEISLVDRPANPEARFECFKLNNGSSTMKKWTAAKLAKSANAMEAVTALARLLGMTDESLAGLEGEALVDAVMAAYAEHEKPAAEDAVGQAMDAAVESLVESVDAMEAEDLEAEGDGEAAPAGDGETETEEKADGDEAAAADAAAGEGEAQADEAAAGDEGQASEGEDKEKADGAEGDEAGDKDEEGDDAEKVSKSAYHVSEAASLAERVMGLAKELEFVAEWGDAPAALAAEINALAVSLYEKMSALAAFEAERVTAENAAGQAAASAAEAPAGEASAADALVEAVAKRAAEAAVAALVGRLETLEKAAGVRDRFTPRQFKDEAKAGLKLVTKGGAEVVVKTAAEAKGAGASMRDVLKGVFAGQIQG